MSWLLKRVVTHKKSSKLKLTGKKSYYHNFDRDIQNYYNEQLDAQKRTFTRWCNAQLSKVEIPHPLDTPNNTFSISYPGTSNQPYSYLIVDLGKDLQDGIRLLKLLEVLSGKETPKPERAGRVMMRIHKILNVGKALTFLQSQLQEPLQNIGSEDIVDGNLKLTMALIWILILKYKISLAFEQEFENENKIEEITDEEQLTTEEKEESLDIFPSNAEYNDLKHNSAALLKRSNGVKRLSTISNKNYSDLTVEMTDKQQKAKNSWNNDDILPIPELSSPNKKNSWRRSTIRHSKTLNRRMSSYNNGNFNFKQEMNNNDLTSPLRKSASVASPLSSQNPKMLLLNWCKNVLKLYVELEITNPINDFSKSWQNGVAFLSLIHSIRNDIVPEIDILIQEKIENGEKFENILPTPKRTASLSNPSSSSTFKLYTAEPKDWYNNLERAFQLAEKYFKIVSLLEPNDIISVKNPDERIIMTYISEFYWYIQNEKKLAKEGKLPTPTSSDASETESNISEKPETIPKHRKRANTSTSMTLNANVNDVNDHKLRSSKSQGQLALNKKHSNISFKSINSIFNKNSSNKTPNLNNKSSKSSFNFDYFKSNDSSNESSSQKQLNNLNNTNQKNHENVDDLSNDDYSTHSHDSKSNRDSRYKHISYLNNKDNLQQRLDNEIKNYLNIADKFSLWIKETQQIQYQILWFLFSMTNVNEKLDHLSLPQSTISPIYDPIFDVNSNVDDLDSTVKSCISKLEYELNNLDNDNSNGAVIKQQFNKAFEQITKTASIIDKEMKESNMNENQKMNSKRSEISSIATIYSTHSSILQHLEQLTKYTFPQTKKILQNYVRWNKEWNEVLNCVNEDLIITNDSNEENINEIADISMTESILTTRSGAIALPINNNNDTHANPNTKCLKQEVEDWIKKIDEINEKVSELMLRREQAMKVRRNTLQAYSNNFNFHKQSVTKNRWILLYNITKDQVKKSIFNNLYDIDIEKINSNNNKSNEDGNNSYDRIDSDDVFNSSKVFSQLENELALYSKSLNSEYPAKLNNLYQRIESLITFLEAEFKNRTQLNTRRIFPSLPLGGVTRLTKLPTLTSIPPPNLQFSYFPQFMIKNADDIIDHGKNEVLQPLINDGIERVSNLGNIVLDLLQNITNRRKESDKLQDILLKEEQREAENLRYIQNKIMEYYRMIKRLEIWIDNTKQDLNIFKEQIPDINSRLKDKTLSVDVEYIETDRTALDNTKKWCINITNTIEDMMKENYLDIPKKNSQNLSKSNFNRLWREIKNDIVSYEGSEIEDITDESSSSISVIDDTMESYIPKHSIHEILFNSLKEFNLSIHKFINSAITPTQETLNDLINKKVNLLKEDWTKESANVKEFLENSRKNQYNNESFEVIEDKIKKQLKSIFENWNNKVKIINDNPIESPRFDKERSELYKYNMKEVKSIQEVFNQQLTSLFQNLSQIISMRTENEVPTFNQQLIDFENDQWNHYIDLSFNLKNFLKLIPQQQKDISIKEVDNNVMQLTALKNEVMEINTSFIQKETNETPVVMKRLLSYNQKANTVLDISKRYNDKINIISQLVDTLTSDNNINNELEKIYTSIYAAIKKMISDNSELELSEIENISLMRPAIFNIQQQLKEVIYANIMQLDDSAISKRNSMKRVSQVYNISSVGSLDIVDLENDDVCKEISDFSKEYVQFNQGIIDYYNTICHAQYLNIQQLLTETTEWYNIYHQLFEWISAADRLRVDNEERIKKYSSGGTYEVPYGFESKLDKKRIEEIEQEQSRLENRHKEFKNGSRYRRVISSKKNILDSMNKIGTAENVLSKNKRLLNAVLNINERHTSLMFTKENRKAYETENYTLLPEIIKKFVEYRLKKFSRVERKLMEIIQIRSTDIIVCKKIFNEVNLPNRSLYKDIASLNDDLDNILVLQKQNIDNVDNYESIMKSINSKATTIVNHTLELIQNIRNIVENSVIKEYELLSKELLAITQSSNSNFNPDTSYDGPNLTEYQENKIKKIKKKFSSITSAIMEKTKDLNEHYENVLEELTKNIVRNWEEKSNIIQLENYIINLKGNLNKYIEIYENIPTNSMEHVSKTHLNTYIQEAIQTFETYQEEIQTHEPLIESAKQSTDKIIKTLRSLISSSNNSVISQVSNSLYESIQNSPTPKMASPFETLLSENNEIIKKRSMDTLSLTISTMKRPNTSLYNKPEEILNRYKNINTFFTKIKDIIDQELSFAYQSKDILSQYGNAEALLSSLGRRINKFIELTSTEKGVFTEKDKANDGIISQFEDELHEVEKVNINKNLSEIIDNLIGSQSEKSTVMEETIISIIKEDVDELKEHAKSLQEQIVSLKRSKILFEGYIKQSHEVRNWIIENHDILEKFNKSIDDQTVRCEEVKQKFLAENIEDIPEEEIRIAYQTEEAIINDIIENLNNEEIAIKRYEITYEHLKTYSNKILSDSNISKGVLSDSSLKIINEYQEKVNYLWNKLNNKLEILKNRLEIRIKILLWIKKMEESEAEMWTLEENIEKAEELNVEVDLEDNPAIQFGKAVDEIMRDWEYKVSFREETHENLKNELNDIEARAESIHCEAELDVFNRNWYLINISESLASLQELFEYKKQRLFETSQQLEQWIIQLNSLEEWITVTNSSLKENLESEEFAVIGDNNATNQTNIKTWSHNQISLSLQISSEISNKMKTLITIKEELLNSFNEVVPQITRESYLNWINDCHNKLDTLYEEIEQMKLITEKLLERATQYQQWQEKLLNITSDVDNISELISYEEIDDNMYIALYDRLNNLEKNLKKIVNEQSVPVDISNNETEITNSKNITKRIEDLQRRINENRKFIQDSQENIMKIKIVNTINQELERIDLWCTSTMRDLPKASLLMETMNTSQNSSIKDIESLPIINIEILSKRSDDDLTIDNGSEKELTNTETALRDAIKLHSFVSMELQQNKKDLNILRQTYEDTFRNISSLDSQYKIIEKRLDSVNDTLISGSNRIDIIRRVYSHDKATFEIFAWIDTANKKLQDMMNESEGSKLNAIHELENRMEIFRSSINDYITMTEKTQSIIHNSTINTKEKNNYIRIVNERSNAILSEWDIVNELLTSIKNDKSQKEREMKYNVVLNEINELIGGIKERIFNVGQLNNINNKNEDQLNIVFGRLEGELIAGVYPKLKLFEKELNELDDHNSNEYNVFHKKLNNLHTQADILIEIINERKIKLRILKYVQNHNKITDKIEQQIVEFNKVMDGQNNNMSKSDIETALAVLDSKAMYFNASIFKMIEEAKEQIENIKDSEEELNKDTTINDNIDESNKPKDDWKVLERQHQIEKKWELIKSKVKRRKDLLSAKLISKTEGQSNSGIPRSNRARTNSASSTGSYRLSVLRAGSTTPSNNRTPSRNRARSITPGSSSVKKRNRKPSLFGTSSSPSISPTPPPAPSNLPSGPIRVFIPVNDYIPDPKDKLDVEVARIVNKCPKSIKVTKAEGEGKYWFGEVIPKLCYCRYLRSGLIMVRVGGGWQELGKFLLEHSTLEHRIPLVRSFAPEDATIAEEDSQGQVIEFDRNEAANTSYSDLQKLATSKSNKNN